MFDTLPAWAFVEEPVEETVEDTATADNEPATTGQAPGSSSPEYVWWTLSLCPKKQLVKSPGMPGGKM